MHSQFSACVEGTFGQSRQRKVGCSELVTNPTPACHGGNSAEHPFLRNEAWKIPTRVSGFQPPPLKARLFFQ